MSLDKCETDSLLKLGFSWMAWDAYEAWLHNWRQVHPDDDRDDLTLIDVYYRETVSEG